MTEAAPGDGGAQPMKNTTKPCPVCGDNHTCTMCRAEAERAKHVALRGVVNPLLRIERDKLAEARHG